MVLKQLSGVAHTPYQEDSHTGLPFSVPSTPWPNGCRLEGWMGSITTPGELTGWECVWLNFLLWADNL